MIFKFLQMKPILFFVSSIFFPTFLIAQNCMIFGTIKDSVSNVGVAYAHIIILNETDNNFMEGGITNEKGNYKIDKLHYGIYRMKILCLGYKTKIIDIQFTQEQKKINIDAVIEVDVTVLEEAVVVADRPSIEFKSNKKIVHIDPTAASGGESVAEFLKSIPEIKVDGDVVTLKTFSPTILVNGKPASPAMQNLTQVPANLISSVEVITNPSVRYTPEGLGGIINLKTRRMPDGINGMIQGSASTNNSYNVAGTLNFKTKKWNVFANVFDRFSGVKEKGVLSHFFDSGRTVYQTNSELPRINRLVTRIGTDFELDSMNVFTLYWEYSKRSGTVKQFNMWEDSEWGMNSIREIEQKNKLNSRDNQICFNYIHTFKNTGELDIDLSQFFGFEPSNVDMFFREVTDTLSLYNEDYFKTMTSSININYATPIFKTWDLEIGTALDWEKTEVSDSLSGNFLEYSHIFEMKRLINAYYLSLGKSFGKFDFSVGIRGEYVNQKLNSKIHKSNNGKFDFFPNLGISYRINNNISLNLNYGRRIARPTIWGLTPYATIDYSFPSERSIGNPNLKPAYTNSIDLGAYFKLSKFSISASVSYMNTNNGFAYFYYIKDSLSYTTRKNIAKSQKILFNINFDYYSKFFKVYRPILTVRLGQDFYNSPDTSGNNMHKSFFNYHINLYNIFYIPKGFLIYFDFTYYPRTFNFASTVQDKININLRVRKTFWKRLTVQISFFNILNSKHIENTYGDGFTSKKTINSNTRSVNIGIMYNFGKPIKTRTNVDLNTKRIETQ